MASSRRRLVASTLVRSVLPCLLLALASGCARVVPESDRAAVHADPQPPASPVAPPAPAYAPPHADRAPEPVEGLWYLNVGGSRLTLEVRGDGRGYGATLAAEGDGRAMRVESVAWEPSTGRVRFDHPLGVGREWFDARVTDGVLTGRVAYTTGGASPAPTDYRAHVTGWNATVIDRAPVPRVFDLRWADGRLGRVRIDRAPAGDGLVGTLKVQAREGTGARDEQEERDLARVRWDGARLAFDVIDDAGTGWHYEGEVAGRAIRGTSTSAGAASRTVAWSGARAEVLSHGLTARPRPEADAWRERARRQVALLTMDGAPAPLASRVEVVVADGTPIASRRAPAQGPAQAYTLTELRASHQVSVGGGATVTRDAHLYVARPATQPPLDGFPVVVALNGHYGSARQVMDPDTGYGYGDAYARRGYVVVAVDVSHRPVADRAALYTDLAAGDDPASGATPHPAIHADGLDSDWEEDGERAWDAMRALDYALSRPDVDPKRVTVTGLSMGGEVATLAGALDPRAASVVVAGFAPDLGVIARRANHPCWRWAHADIGEYLDVSDLHALVAPRLMVVETGSADHTFSDFRAPFADDKQVLRRSRVAWGDDAHRLVHFLHDGAHVYRAGDPSVDPTASLGISMPMRTAPDAAGATTWQTDAATSLLPVTVFDLTRDAFGF